jgi:lambda repressor-like predicted transcriptional regulator
MQFSSNIEEMAWLFGTGYSLTAIASKLGVHRETVRRAMLSLGIETSLHVRVSFEARRYGRIAAGMREEGKPWKAISDRIGFSERTLRRYFIEATQQPA